MSYITYQTELTDVYGNDHFKISFHGNSLIVTLNSRIISSKINLKKCVFRIRHQLMEEVLEEGSYLASKNFHTQIFEIFAQ